MRNLMLVGLVSSLLIGTVASSRDRVAPPQKGKPIRIIPPVVRGKFELRVQKDSRFPKEERPAASKPASNDGLQITVQPEKKEFAGNGPLALEVVLTNTSKKPLRLNRVNELGGTPRLVIANQKTAGQWTVKGKTGKSAKTLTLQPGKSTKYTVVVESTGFIRPRPIPLPRPRPLPPRRLPPQRTEVKGADKPVIVQPAGKPKIGIGRPIRRPIVWNPTLPIGQGPCRARLFLEFQDGSKTADAKAAFWTGKIVSGPVDFKIGKPEPGWTPGQPLQKKQAIRLAHPVAERALKAAYKPVAGLRPPKQGPWIESPEKSATAKKDKTGNWTIRWAAFPKTGHQYNVTVKVSKFGGARVTEVFTGYSKSR